MRPTFTPTVVAAARPFNRRETEMGSETHCVANSDRTRMTFRHPLTGYSVNFDFDRFYNLPSSALSDVTHSMNLGQRILQAGFGCYIALGSVGSGKSYCAMGSKQDSPGIIPCWLEDVFKLRSDPQTRVTMSAFEVLPNEMLVDLLEFGEWTATNKALTEGEDLDQRAFISLRDRAMSQSTVRISDDHRITGHTQQPIHAIEDFHAVQATADRFRELDSDRAPVNPQMYLVEVTKGSNVICKIMLVDLIWHADASDRFKLIQCAQNNDAVARGLLALEDVVYGLLSGKRDPSPKLESYRSLLTRVLWPFISGGPCVVFGTFSPSTLEFENSLTTLQYLTRCKQGNRLPTVPTTTAASKPTGIPPLQPLTATQSAAASGTHLAGQSPTQAKQPPSATHASPPTPPAEKETTAPPTPPQDDREKTEAPVSPREKEGTSAAPLPESPTPAAKERAADGRGQTNASPPVPPVPQVQGTNNTSGTRGSPIPPTSGSSTNIAAMFPSSLPPPPSLTSLMNLPQMVGATHHPMPLGFHPNAGSAPVPGATNTAFQPYNSPHLGSRIDQLEAELNNLKSQLKQPAQNVPLSASSSAINSSHAAGRVSPPAVGVGRQTTPGLAPGNRRLSDPWYNSTNFVRPTSNSFNRAPAFAGVQQQQTTAGPTATASAQQQAQQQFSQLRDPSVNVSPFARAGSDMYRHTSPATNMHNMYFPSTGGLYGRPY
eukprot:TRINITY_DN64562_c0_g1_i1.p1 TRINITY_DN64562_c0_g1~~TRINITY_DN64562_c0_g1_i1.p1  ORF type:complete len:732 (+),score=46.79 TRINITY_DN64562_c0_g1_i1:51-2198(+)